MAPIKYTMSIKKPVAGGSHVTTITSPTKPTQMHAAIQAAIGGTGAAVAPAPSTVATGSTPAGGSSAPVDPILDANLAAATRNRNQTMVGLAAERAQLGSIYGYGQRPDGSVFDDVSNPYSRAAVLQTLYDQHKAGNTNSMAARGQLYSGALQTEQNNLADQTGRSRDALIREFLAAQGGITNRETAASNAFDDAGTQARAESIARLLAARPDPASVAPYVPPSTAPAPAATSYAAKTTKKYVVKH